MIFEWLAKFLRSKSRPNLRSVSSSGDSGQVSPSEPPSVLQLEPVPFYFSDGKRNANGGFEGYECESSTSHASDGTCSDYGGGGDSSSGSCGD